jgi:hypothetical protein
MDGSVFNATRAALASTGNSSSVRIRVSEVEASLGSWDSKKVSHRSIEFSFATGAPYGTVLARNGKHTVLLTPRGYPISTEEVEMLLGIQDNYAYEVVQGVLPRAFASDLLKRAKDAFTFGDLDDHALVQVYAARRRLAWFDDEGIPVYVTEDLCDRTPTEESTTVEVEM